MLIDNDIIETEHVERIEHTPASGSNPETVKLHMVSGQVMTLSSQSAPVVWDFFKSHIDAEI